ncbi:MAG: helix-turn-helix transcriptional regulator [Bacteroidetes bacterium]|nr:helix-turn-helix transcriptional regulator [Bacteroidota bacterium]
MPRKLHESKLVRSLRERLGITQEQLASKLGVTFTSVNRWENGRTKPSPLALKRIEELLREISNDGSDLLREYFD